MHTAQRQESRLANTESRAGIQRLSSLLLSPKCVVCSAMTRQCVMVSKFIVLPELRSRNRHHCNIFTADAGEASFLHECETAPLRAFFKRLLNASASAEKPFGSKHIQSAANLRIALQSPKPLELLLSLQLPDPSRLILRRWKWVARCSSPISAGKALRQTRCTPSNAVPVNASSPTSSACSARRYRTRS